MTDTQKLVIDALMTAAERDTPAAVLEDLQNGKDIPLAALELESLSRFEVIMQIEEALDIELDDDEITAQDTVGGLIALIDARRQGT